MGYGGEGGIRTLGTARFTRFRVVRFQPLSHLSVFLGRFEVYLPRRPGRSLRAPCRALYSVASLLHPFGAAVAKLRRSLRPLCGLRVNRSATSPCLRRFEGQSSEPTGRSLRAPCRALYSSASPPHPSGRRRCAPTFSTLALLASSQPLSHSFVAKAARGSVSDPPRRSLRVPGRALYSVASLLHPFGAAVATRRRYLRGYAAPSRPLSVFVARLVSSYLPCPGQSRRAISHQRRPNLKAGAAPMTVWGLGVSLGVRAVLRWDAKT